MSDFKGAAHEDARPRRKRPVSGFSQPERDLRPEESMWDYLWDLIFVPPCVYGQEQIGNLGPGVTRTGAKCVVPEGFDRVDSTVVVPAGTG